jgi:hypothetical protein
LELLIEGNSNSREGAGGRDVRKSGNIYPKLVDRFKGSKFPAESTGT